MLIHKMKPFVVWGSLGWTGILLVWLMDVRLPPLFSQTVRMEPAATAFMIKMGVGDQRATEWSGKARVDGGKLLRLEGWRFSEDDRIVGGAAWQSYSRVDYREWAGPVAEKEADRPVVPSGIVLHVECSEATRVALTTLHGKFAFRCREIAVGESRSALAGRAEIQRLDPTTRIGLEDRENDWVSLTRDGAGNLWTAWIAYSKGADRVYLRMFDGHSWIAPVPVSENGDCHQTAIAVDAGQRVWVVWSQRVDNNWDIYARAYKDGKLGPLHRLSDAPEQDILPRMTADASGRLHLVWQGFRNGQSDIFLRTLDGQDWGPARQVSDSAANDWEPAVAADQGGKVHVVWDTYERGNYDIAMRTYQSGKSGEKTFVAASSEFEAHVDAICDKLGRLWLAWDEGGPGWGKDGGKLARGGNTGLHRVRRIRLAVLEGGRWMEPAQPLAETLPNEMANRHEYPRLAIAPDGAPVLFFRYGTLWPHGFTGRPERGLAIWNFYRTSYSGTKWSAALPVLNSNGRSDVRLSVLPDGAYAAWQTDQRPYANPAPARSEIFFGAFGSKAAGAPQLRARTESAPKPEADTAGGAERKAVERLRAYRLRVGRAEFRIVRGDMHRHTDISWDGENDGSLLDAYRYALDASSLDFMAVTDHQAGFDQEYSWWRTQKFADLFQGARFRPLFGYERSLLYPNGHRNVIYARRGVRTLPPSLEEFAGIEGAGKLFHSLKETGGITMPHTSATNMGTDWRDHREDVQPLVEIYQGARNSYEYQGAPKAAEASDPRPSVSDVYPLGFVWRAWKLGYKIGVQCSSDHTSTHISYAMLLAEEPTREGMMAAIRKRHSYGATDNILLDYRMTGDGSEHLMGDAFAATERPRLKVKVAGTGPLKQVDVIRDQSFVLTRRGEGPDLEFEFADNEAAGEHYYYVRVQQEDGQMAWGSPIWVNIRK